MGATHSQPTSLVKFYLFRLNLARKVPAVSAAQPDPLGSLVQMFGLCPLEPESRHSVAGRKSRLSATTGHIEVNDQPSFWKTKPPGAHATLLRRGIQGS